MSTRTPALALALAVAACADGAPGRDTSPADASTPDAIADDAIADDAFADATDATLDAPPETALDVPPDAAPDIDPIDAIDADAGPEDVDAAPRRCHEGEACNVLRDDAGACPGACVAVEDVLRCRGVVVDAICHPADPRIVDPTTLTMAGLDVVVVDAPEPAQVGELRTIVVDVHNPGAATARRAFGTSGQDTWELVDANFLDWGAELVVPAHGTTPLTMTMRAAKPDVLDQNQGRVIAIYIGDAELTLHAHIGFDPASPVRCGGFPFPGPDVGRCCGEVFYPGALCCDSADCPGGACADGHCVTGAPDLGIGRPIHGTHRILVVVADEPAFATDDPCADRTAELRGPLGLDDVTRFYADRTRARVARDVVDFRWTVLAGLASDDIVAAGPERWVPFYRDHLATWLDAHPGCPALADFDEVVIAAAGMDLHGYGGVFMGRGLVGASTWRSPWLFAHELGHAFGATDLGHLLGNRFLWTVALMGTFAAPEASDRVAWAQWGLGDVDHSGVIDLAERAAYPETFDVADAAAEVVPVGTFGGPELQLSWRPVALEGGALRGLVHDDFAITLSEHGWSRTWSQEGATKRIAFQHDELRWDDVLARRTLTVTLAATHPFTRADGTRAAVTLARTLEVPVTVPE